MARKPTRSRRSKAKAGRKLSAKQARFVAEYLVDSNATQAAIRSGYSAKTAEVCGPRLLGNVRVAQAIEIGRAKLANKLEVTAERVTAEVARLAFADIGEVLDFDGDTLRLRKPKSIPEDVRRAIQSVKIKRALGRDDDGNPVPVELVEFKFHPKTTALQQLIDKLGLKAPTKIAPTDPTGEKPFAGGVMVVPGGVDAAIWEGAATRHQAELASRE